MATYTDLSSLFTAIANSIRAKRHITGSIVANNFPEEINKITENIEVIVTLSNFTCKKYACQQRTD